MTRADVSGQPSDLNQLACDFVNDPANRWHFASDSARLVMAQVPPETKVGGVVYGI